jgi:hypothetical protein
MNVTMIMFISSFLFVLNIISDEKNQIELGQYLDFKTKLNLGQSQFFVGILIRFFNTLYICPCRKIFNRI